MTSSLRIGLIGDFDAAAPSHRATNEAIAHAGAALDFDARVEWIGTECWADAARLHELLEFDGLWAAPGALFRSLEGGLAVIRTARERGLPFTGT